MVALLVVACAGGAPLQVHHAPPDYNRRSIRSNVASTGELSDYTLIVLRNHVLIDLHGGDPELAIRTLHESLATREAPRDEYFALAELSFLHAEQLEHRAWKRARDREKRRNGGMVRKAPIYTSDETPLIEKAKSYYRAAAIYAYTFLFVEDETSALAIIDPRFRIAADLYSRAVVESFTNMAGYQVFTGGRFDLPFGELVVEFDEMDLRWENRLLIDFLPSDEFSISGLRNRYRRAGIGAPLAARTVPLNYADPSGYLVARRAVVAVNAVLMLEDPAAQLAADEIVARLTLSPAAEASDIEVNGRPLPLEVQPSVALAASLQESDVWRSRLAVFFGRDSRLNDDNRFFGWEPRRRGQIPVVFVHGTMSTPVVWADMVNDLQNDPVLRDRYQFLFFAYESGNPILYSSMLLRRSIDRAVEVLDPSGTDDCLRDMVLIGHSQGGLLVKTQAIETGSKLWSAVSDVPLEKSRYNAGARALLKEAMFLEPDANVGRVVFISTPHRGSYLASSDIARRLSRWAIQFPADLAQISAGATGLSDDPEAVYKSIRIRTSIDNMSPNDPMIRALAKVPVVPSVPAHSIVSVKPDQEIETGDDGVVKYRSAHIDEAESEFVVRVSHSSQGYPKTIEEVQRILRLHAEESACTVGP